MIFTTRDWTGAEIVYTHASGAATYTVSGDAQNAYEVAVALRAWLDDAARPWAADISAVTLAVEEDAAERRLRFAFTFAGSAPTFVSIAPTSAWIACFGDTSQTPPTGCPASTSGVVSVLRIERLSGGPGGRSRDGSWRMEPASSGARAPLCTFAGTTGQAYALGAAVRAASQPRQAYVRDESTGVWTLYTVGGVGPFDHPEDDVTLLTGPIQLLGGL